jgi:hypothetical protein
VSRRPRRAFWVAVVLSLVLHGLTGWSLARDWTVLPEAAPPPPAAPSSPRIDFNLVETPESARVETPPEDPELFSDRDSRSQDTAPEGEVTERPRAVTDGEGLEQRVQAAAPEVEPWVDAMSSTVAQAYPQPEVTAREVPESRERAEVEVAAPVEEPRPRRPEQRPAPRTPPAESAAPRRDTPRPGAPGFSEAEKAELERALERGEFSYEATQHFFADYYLRMRREVEVTWNLLLSTRYLGLDPSRAVVDFQVLPDGSLGEVHIRTLEGDELFAGACVGSIRRSAPFGPVPYDARLPEETRGLPLHMRYTFTLRNR